MTQAVMEQDMAKWILQQLGRRDSGAVTARLGD
jgi:hypothetical protein